MEKAREDIELFYIGDDHIIARLRTVVQQSLTGIRGELLAEDASVLVSGEEYSMGNLAADEVLAAKEVILGRLCAVLHGETGRISPIPLGCHSTNWMVLSMAERLVCLPPRWHTYEEQRRGMEDFLAYLFLLDTYGWIGVCDAEYPKIQQWFVERALRSRARCLDARTAPELRDAVREMIRDCNYMYEQFAAVVRREIVAYVPDIRVPDVGNGFFNACN